MAAKRLAVIALLLVPAVGFSTDLTGTISSAVTLPAGDHRLVGNLTITASGSLTLEAGARLLAQGNFIISVYGRFEADGTTADWCLVGHAADGKGNWQGIFVMTGGQLVAQYCQFRNATTAITCNSANLQLTHCSISRCSRDGVAVYGTSAVAVDQCAFSETDRRGLFLETTDVTGSVGECSFASIGEYPVVAKATLVEMLAGPFSLTDIAKPWIGVSCSADEDITDADTWRNLGIDYDLTAGSSDELLIAPSGHLVLEAGVRLRCASVRVEGKLTAQGAAQRVVFYGPAGSAGAAGDWKGIEVAGGTLELTSAAIRCASTAITASDATVSLSDVVVSDAQFDGIWTTGATVVNAQNCRFRDIGRSALRLMSGGTRGQITECSFIRCGDWPVLAKPNAVGALGSGLSFVDNARQAVGVYCVDTTDITRTQTWTAQPVPYDLSADPDSRLVAVKTGVRLTLAAGVRLYNGGVACSGEIVIAGTADAPVVFASTGTYRCLGLTFRPGSQGAVTWADISGANVGVTVRDASPRLEHLTVHDCATDGLLVTGNSAQPVVVECSIIDNGRYGVRIEDGASPNLGDVGNASTDDDGRNQIHGNGGPYDVVNYSAADVKAENNWWGTDSEAAIRARIYDRDEDPTVGLVDTWPFLSQRPNNAPELAWLGTAPYQFGGVAPEVGTPSTIFVWKVRYSDPDGDPPRYVRVHILKGGSDIADSPFEMTTADPSPDFRAGVVYEFSRTLPSSRQYSYYFEAADQSLAAGGEPTQPRDGPLVTTRPVLSWAGTTGFVSDGVEPDSGYDDTTFEFRVKYIDADGDQPVGVFVHIYLDGQPIAGSPFELEHVSGTPQDGAIYARGIVLQRASADGYTYKFSASDGILAASGEPTSEHQGPSVQYRPHLAYVGTAGYERDGVEPQAAAVGARFRFRVTYLHRGGVEPQFIRLHVARGNTEVAGSPWDLEPLDNAPVTEGRRYGIEVVLPAGRDYRHWFEASDGQLVATGPPTEPAAGPLSDHPPELSFLTSGATAGDGLAPDAGATGATEFVWEVRYSDPEGDPPRYVRLRLFLDGAELPDSPFEMSPVPGGDWRSGKVFRLCKRLTQTGQWRYCFVASDGYVDAGGEPTAMHDGPAVQGGIELIFPHSGPLGRLGRVPQVGEPDKTRFVFHIIYRHRDGLVPVWVRLQVRHNRLSGDVDTYDMTAVNDEDVAEGRLYQCTLALPEDVYSYWFEAYDGRAVCRTDEIEGPGLNHPPELSWVGEEPFVDRGVDPLRGPAGVTLNFRVVYRDADGDPPAWAAAMVCLGTQHYLVPLQVASPEPRDYRSGVELSGSLRIQTPGEYTYFFRVNDGTAQAVGPPAEPQPEIVIEPASTAALAFISVAATATPAMVTVHCRVSVSGCVVRGRVLNIAGREVGKLRTLRCEGQEAALAWGRLGRYGSPAPPGLYLIELEAASPDGAQARAVVPVRLRASPRGP